MQRPTTLEEAAAIIALLENALELKSQAITWLEKKLILTEAYLRNEREAKDMLLREQNELHARVAVYSMQNDRMSERVFMCENEPSLS